MFLVDVEKFIIKPTFEFRKKLLYHEVPWQWNQKLQWDICVDVCFVKLKYKETINRTAHPVMQKDVLRISTELNTRWFIQSDCTSSNAKGCSKN